MVKTARAVVSKVPEVTFGFGIIKIVATTLGETAGDAVTMSMNLGYLIGTAIFAAIFVVAVSTQISAKRFHPFLYWAVIVATTTAGTTLADLVDRSLGIGYLGGSIILFALLLGRRRHSIRRRLGSLRGNIFLDKLVAHCAVLGRLYPHPASRGPRLATSSISRSLVAVSL